jgi:hypothetical protein
MRSSCAGFHFRIRSKLASVGLIDPKASDQNNNFGNGNIPAAQDYEDIKAAQKSFDLMAGYLKARPSTSPTQTIRSAYTGAYITEDLFKIIACLPVLGAISTPKTTSRRTERRDSRRRNLASRFQCRSQHCRTESHS